MQTQSALNKPCLTDSQQELLHEMVSRSAVQIEEASRQVADVKTLLEAGLISLRVLMNPWGLDYDLVPTRLGFELRGCAVGDEVESE